MTGIVSLPMYDWPEFRAETERFWSTLREALARRGIAAPAQLERRRSASDTWSDPDLLLSQTCGWPWATRYRETLHLLASPCYHVAGCRAGTYSSAIVVRRDSDAATLGDLHGGRVAFNSEDSQSGVHTLREAVAGYCTEGTPFFADAVKTGSHRASIETVAAGGADCAAIDAVCWALAGRAGLQAASQLRVLVWSPPAAALPFVVGSRWLPMADQISAALDDAIAGGAGRGILLSGIAPPDRTGYLDLPERVGNAPPLVGVTKQVSDGRA